MRNPLRPPPRTEQQRPQPLRLPVSRENCITRRRRPAGHPAAAVLRREQKPFACVGAHLRSICLQHQHTTSPQLLFLRRQKERISTPAAKSSPGTKRPLLLMLLAGLPSDNAVRGLVQGQPGERGSDPAAVPRQGTPTIAAAAAASHAPRRKVQRGRGRKRRQRGRIDRRLHRGPRRGGQEKRHPIPRGCASASSPSSSAPPGSHGVQQRAAAPDRLAAGRYPRPSHIDPERAPKVAATAAAAVVRRIGRRRGGHVAHPSHPAPRRRECAAVSEREPQALTSSVSAGLYRGGP